MQFSRSDYEVHGIFKQADAGCISWKIGVTVNVKPIVACEHFLFHSQTKLRLCSNPTSVGIRQPISLVGRSFCRPVESRSSNSRPQRESTSFADMTEHTNLRLLMLQISAQTIGERCFGYRSLPVVSEYLTGSIKIRRPLNSKPNQHDSPLRSVPIVHVVTPLAKNPELSVTMAWTFTP